MSETKRIQAFNQQLDRLLAGVSVDGQSPDLLEAQDRAALRAAATLAGADFNAEIRPRAGLLARARAAAQPARRMAPPGLRWGLAALVIALLALLVVFREPVAASLGRLFGFAYVPGAGFVPVDTVRVLKNPVTQQNGERSLTVLRGLASAQDTQLWLEYSDVARAADGAWLETGAGQRFDLRWWGWEPDEPGSRGVRLVFPPLPAEVSQVTLALPEGWRIPLEWIPAAESSLQPANLVTEPLTPTPAVAESGPPPGETVGQAQPCAEVAALRLCVQAAARSAQGLELMVEAQSSAELKPGLLQDHTLVAFATQDSQLRLLDAQGKEYAPSEAIQIFPYGEGRLGEGLVFTDAQDVTGRLSLVVPAVYTNLSFSHEIVIDLGEDPQAGQEFALDQTVDVAGIPVHFTRALVEENPGGGLRLKLTSQPVETRDGVTPYLLMMTRPERVDSGYGEGSANGVLSLSVDLMQPSGKLSGLLRLPLVGASVRLSGPFNLTFDAPAAQAAATETPQVIENGEFQPLPTGQALSMETYRYSGRALQPGDLLAVGVGTDTSMLYAAAPGGPAEVVATLPGQVLAVYVHPDRGGIDYISGALDLEEGNRYEQLYTLRFADGPPRLLVGSFERLAYGFAWSFDGRWLAYQAPPSAPGEGGARRVHLVDLACRETGTCAGQVAPAPEDLDLYELVWSPVEERLLALGVPQTQSYGMSDVFTLWIDPQDGRLTLTNLTESPQINDQSVQWLADGKGLLITCSTDEMEINYYGLCRNDLQVGMDQVVDTRLPFNMRVALLTPDGRTLVDRLPVFENGARRLRAYDTTSGQTRSLIEWPAAKGGLIEPVLSPQGEQVAVVEPGMRSLLAIGLVDGQSRPVLQSSEPLNWIGWVR